MIDETKLIEMIETNDYAVKLPNANITGLGMFTADILRYIAQCTKADKIKCKPSYNIDQIQHDAMFNDDFDI